MTILLATIIWLACAAFNVWGFSKMFQYTPVTLFDVFMCTLFAPIMAFVVFGGLAGKVVLIKPRKK
jgi:hypothetical protein